MKYINSTRDVFSWHNPVSLVRDQIIRENHNKAFWRNRQDLISDLIKLAQIIDNLLQFQRCIACLNASRGDKPSQLNPSINNLFYPWMSNTKVR